MEQHMQLVTFFQAHIVVIGRDHNVDKNPREVFVSLLLFFTRKKIINNKFLYIYHYYYMLGGNGVLRNPGIFWIPTVLQGSSLYPRDVPRTPGIFIEFFMDPGSKKSAVSL